MKRIFRSLISASQDFLVKHLVLQDRDSALKSNPLVSNILLLGVDGSADSSSRSDSMILVSVDYLHGKIKLTSFLRDSWVYIPSKDKFCFCQFDVKCSILSV